MINTEVLFCAWMVCDFFFLCIDISAAIFFFFFSEDAVSLRSSTPGEQGGKVGWRERLVAS